MILAKRISEKERKEIVNDFNDKKSLEEISKRYGFTKSTISRHLKKSLGEDKFNEINKLIKNEKIKIDSEKLVEIKPNNNITFK